MARYAVGDLQGYLPPLMAVLERAGFNERSDELWLVGDLVNRGPDNAAILRFVRNLPHHRVVLGNHDLHLLAIAHGVRPPRRSDTFDDVLQAPDREELLHWLHQQPLLHCCERTKKVMTHAGIPFFWTVAQAQALSDELHQVLTNNHSVGEFFPAMYGNTPDRWHDNLTGPERWRTITNYFTRMRFLDPEGHIEFDHKETPDHPPTGWKPWYELRTNDGWQHYFGHWAALMGNTGRSDIVGLDTGYGWGNWLTLMDIDRGERWTHPA
ncbi:symmetrical bis(5'-nucleosyl)-tetraphosphatase [Salinispirillum marinum]|uniref:bis(5'-nucleosyl)-tetraphosphatase (symmetrical) n=2 Tax=Saccharospirillaceae TaxID=255527 RepID=A0ABV8B972_9GAMM